MNILYDPFCVIILDKSDQQEYRQIAKDIFNVFKGLAFVKEQHIYLINSTEKYVGFSKDGTPTEGKEPWAPVISLYLYKVFAERVIKNHKTFKNKYFEIFIDNKIDNYTLI